VAQIIRRIAAEIFYVALKSTAQASISTSMSGKSIPVSDQYPEQEIITDSAVEGEAQGKAHASPSTSHTIELRNPGSVRGGWDLLQLAMPGAQCGCGSRLFHR